MKTKEELLELIRDYEISDKICTETGNLITANEGYYLLDGMVYSEEVDIDTVIKHVIGGEYSTKEELYEDGSDYYYWTTQENEEGILENILYHKEYYNILGDIIKL